MFKCQGAVQSDLNFSSTPCIFIVKTSDTGRRDTELKTAESVFKEIPWQGRPMKKVSKKHSVC